MQVQDLVRLDVNVTAEISNEDAKQFQKLCQLFAAELQDPKVLLRFAN